MENCVSAVGFLIRLFTWPSDQPRHATKRLNLPERNQIAPVKALQTRGRRCPRSRRRYHCIGKNLPQTRGEKLGEGIDRCSPIDKDRAWQRFSLLLSQRLRCYHETLVCGGGRLFPGWFAARTCSGAASHPDRRRGQGGCQERPNLPAV